MFGDRHQRADFIYCHQTSLRYFQRTARWVTRPTGGVIPHDPKVSCSGPNIDGPFCDPMIATKWWSDLRCRVAYFRRLSLPSPLFWSKTRNTTPTAQRRSPASLAYGYALRVHRNKVMYIHLEVKSIFCMLYESRNLTFYSVTPRVTNDSEDIGWIVSHLVLQG